MNASARGSPAVRDGSPPIIHDRPSHALSSARAAAQPAAALIASRSASASQWQ